MVSLRALLAAGLGLLACAQAQAQLCSDYMKCPAGYICSRIIPGSAMGSCTRSGVGQAEKEAKAACEVRQSKELCAKSELCTWLDKADECATRCELRKAQEACGRTDICAWVEKIDACVTKCNTWRSRDTCAKDERCGWIENYDYCLTRRGADQKPRPR